ncbi:DUF4376 domain-containing protein [Paraburkholderia sp. A3BS-1L]|uniref:DUF4376 domain-containing protein n=1 Tax=Paraburkholderia sp. A3BS-1L TaxID=3028375 RepID=UPI003DAA2907
MNVYVQFSDATETTIIASFGCPQSSAAFPNQATIDSSDARYQAFINPASTLAGAQSAKIAALTAAYQAAIQQPVSYTSKGGATKTYQADAGSIANLTQMLLAFQSSQTVPVGFYWVSLDNTQVPFSYADMQALANALGTQGAAAFQQLQTLRGKVNAAATVAAVQTIDWP